LVFIGPKVHEAAAKKSGCRAAIGLVVAQHPLRTCNAERSITTIRCNSHEREFEALCSGDVAIRVAHENDPLEPLPIMGGCARDREVRDCASSNLARAAPHLNLTDIFRLQTSLRWD
jgi:hypothetical protein